MTSCSHCDEITVSALFNEDDVNKLNAFCCYGCLTVYNIIHEKGLGTYYDIKKDSAFFKRRSPVEVKNQKFQFLDDPEFLDQYSYRNLENFQTMEFYLEGIHCLACLWLIEKLPEFIPLVMTTKLDVERSVVTVVLSEGGKFSRVASELNNLGYRPHALKNNQEAINLKIQEERSVLLRIGVAGAASGNIMIYAVSLYGGAADNFASLFNLLTVFFAIPVLTYCAYPFYKSAWSALKNRILSIDFPISIALIMGALMGFYNLVMGIPENYFDSLTTLVFLLLISRYFLQKIQETSVSSKELHFFYSSESVLVSDNIKPYQFKEVHSKFIKVQDILKIRPGDIVPIDGVVIEGSSNFNMSLLTGESLPIKVSVGENVYSGTQNLDQEIIVDVQKIKNETRLGKILESVEDGWGHRSSMIDMTSIVSRYFTMVVFILAAILFLILARNGDLKFATEQALTLLIVTCPCALALSMPLTFSRALSKAAKKGIIIKNDKVIERLSKIKNVFLDKTGTITFGKLKVIGLTQLKETEISLEEIIFNLEKKSLHPVGIALFDFVKDKRVESFPVRSFSEVIGKGVSGEIQNHLYEINRAGIFEDKVLVGQFCVTDTVRPDSKKSLEKLTYLHLNVNILSGDEARVVKQIGKDVNLKEENVYWNLSPEEKARLVESTPNSVMVGDGANDAIALARADVGVAVLGAMDISLQAADVYLTVPGLDSFEKLIILSRETMKVVRRNLVLSLIYNSLSVSVVFMGMISPLIAAVIMPLSSVTVLISTLIGTKKLRNIWK